MGTMKKGVIFLVIGLAGLAGCAFESLTYRTVTDGVDKKEYRVVGRVTDAANRPIENCRIFFSKQRIDMAPGEFSQYPDWETYRRSRQYSEPEPVFVTLTDQTGNYHFLFELDGATRFWIHFDAREQGYPIRYENVSHHLESTLFQYTGNNPLIVNVVMNKAPDGQPR